MQGRRESPAYSKHPLLPPAGPRSRQRGGRPGVLLAGVDWTLAAGGKPSPCLASRWSRRAPCCQQSGGRRSAGRDHRLADVAAKAVRVMLGRPWRSSCRNPHEEVWWWLAYRGLPLAHPTPDRRHHFWDCLTSQGVLDTIATQLVPPQLPFAPAHIWLGRVPPRLHAGVWDVVRHGQGQAPRYTPASRQRPLGAAAAAAQRLSSSAPRRGCSSGRNTNTTPATAACYF